MKTCRGSHLLLDDLKKQLHHVGVKVLSRLLADIFHCIVLGPGGAVWPVGGERIPDICDRKDAGRDGDLFSLQPLWVA
jgi:hypothetical protein